MKSEYIMQLVNVASDMRGMLRDLGWQYKKHEETLKRLRRQPVYFFQVFKKRQIRNCEASLKKLAEQENSMKDIALLHDLLISTVRKNKVSDNAVVGFCLEIAFALIYPKISSVHTEKQKKLIEKMSKCVYFVAEVYSKAS